MNWAVKQRELLHNAAVVGRNQPDGSGTLSNQIQNWKRKSKGNHMTTMNTAPGDPPVERAQMSEHFSSEQDATHLYRPKGMQYETSMQQTRFVLPNDVYGPVRSHAIVALTPSAIMVDRRRSWEQLHRMADAGDEQAIAVLEALQGFTLD
jgi:hypothetical protein